MNDLLVCNRLIYTKEYNEELDRYESLGLSLPEDLESTKFNAFKFCCETYMIQAFTQFEDDNKYCVIWMDEENFIIDKPFDEVLKLKQGVEFEVKDGKSKES